MNKKIEVTLSPDKNNENLTINFKELYESLKEEIETYEKLGMLEELMESPVNVNVCDIEGNVIYGYVTLVPGFLEGGTFVICSNLSDVYK